MNLQLWKEVLASQYGAALDMMENAIHACPDTMWEDASLPVDRHARERYRARVARTRRPAGWAGRGSRSRARDRRFGRSQGIAEKPGENRANLDRIMS
jgi:hypothetical protein